MTAAIRAREAGTASGMALAALTFRMVHPDLRLQVLIPDGENFASGDILARITGDAAAILSAERVALNFAGRLSVIPTITAAFAA
jgi:nicotinate-nucleotide pyrophosphorylase (carboxylating)